MPDHETSDFPPMMRRLLRAHAVRVGQGDTYDLREMWELRDELDAAIVMAIGLGRETQPDAFSWAGIGDALGVRRQTIEQWYRRRAATAFATMTKPVPR